MRRVRWRAPRAGATHSATTFFLADVFFFPVLKNFDMAAFFFFAASAMLLTEG